MAIYGLIMPGELEDYRRKRDFQKTPEPQGTTTVSDEKPIFVVQKHQATALHYDFRLEVGGVLKSWAVPKGPSMDPSIKRLAVPTEDHPREYANFEGRIPEGEYGGGAVIVWDRGTFEHLPERGESIEEAVRNGHIIVRLHGKKLTGGFALIRAGKKGDQRWLLIKMRDESANHSIDKRDISRSVLSGRTLEEVAKQKT